MTEENEANNDSDKPDGGHNDGSSLGYLRGVCVAALWVFIALLLASIFWPNLSERTKFFTTNFFNLLIAFAVIAQVLLYRKQWDAMQEGLRETRISRELENAAFVGVKGASFVDGGLRVGERQRIHVTIVNTGRTPAFNLRVTQGSVISPLGPGQFVPSNPGLPPRARSTVMSNADALIAFFIPNLSQADFDAINNFQRYVYVWGTVEYDDIFGRPHWTKFCLMHHPTTTVFDNCAHNNECDYQDQTAK